MKELEYDEFEVLLERSGDGYTARVVESPTGPVPALPFVPPEPLGGLPALRLAVRGETATDAGAPLGTGPAAPSAAQSPKQFGAELFRALFNDRALAILRTSQFVSARRQRGLRLRIRFADATPLANLPWELLYDPERHWFPCQLSRFPTIRFVDIPEPVQPLEVTGPLRMLVAISSPSDLPVLDVEREWTLLRTEMQPLVAAGRLELERLPVASLEAVRQTLLAREFHIFHFIGHGGVDPSTGEGQLAFTGPDGRQRRVTGSQLGVMLSNSPIRLAVLNSCEGGRISDVDPYASTAITLVEQGIPAVVAMQFQISDAAATAFSRTFYDSVTSGRPVDIAVTLARQAVLAASETEWATPVLYLRAVDGVLFDLTQRDQIVTPAAEPVHRAEGAPTGPPPPVGEPVVVDLPPPEDVHVHVVDGVVDLGWRQPPTGSHPVESWEVWRNGEQVAVVDEPALRDRPPGPGTYHYRLVALAADGSLSMPSDEAVVVLTPPAPEPPPPPVAVPPARERVAATGGAPPPADGAYRLGGAGAGGPVGGGAPVQRRRSNRWWLALLLVPIALGLFMVLRPAETPTPGPATSPSSDSPVAQGQQQEPARADLSLTRSSPGEGGGSGEVTLTYLTSNGGPRSAVDERVDVSLTGDGALLVVTVRRPGQDGAVQCAITDVHTATCFVGRHAVGQTATVNVVVGSGDPPPTVNVTVKSATRDPDLGNNRDSFGLPAIPVPQPGST